MGMMSVAPLVYVVILTHNNLNYTLQALKSLINMTYPNFRLLMVDNRSTDGTVETVGEDHPEIKVLAHSSNLGFAAGINPGIRYAIKHKADFVLIINSDVIVAPSMLTHLVEAMEPGIAATSPMIYCMDAPRRIWSSGFSRHPLCLEMRGGARGQIDHGQWRRALDVDYLLGCAMLLDALPLGEIGLFDERYFFYYEDLDFSLRVQQRGYRLVTVPEAKMWHKGAGSAGMGSAFRTYHMARGSVIFSRTHTRGLQRPASLLFRLASALKTSLRFLWRRDFHLLLDFWQGLADGWQAS